ncbi:MAG: hypothetical protein BWY09_00351 [Candidatus Hydrogenedentes bacterium ADurb.Bin179]|nr:MAG: hypothetical protein BWY09_00351 [Candidatus Hydrogenedentes bacterium ADurb.Bin179]
MLDYNIEDNGDEDSAGEPLEKKPLLGYLIHAIVRGVSMLAGYLKQRIIRLYTFFAKQPEQVYPEPDKTRQICIIGSEGSGKSCLLAGLQILNDATLDSSFDLHHNSKSGRFFHQAADALRRGEWPTGTTQEVIVETEVAFKGKQFLLKLIDYPGEVVRQVFGQYREQKSELLDVIQQAGFILLLIDGEKDFEAPEDRIKRTLYQERLNALIQVIRYRKRQPSYEHVRFAVLITKADSAPESIYAPEKARSYLQRLHPHLLNRLLKHDENLMVFGVSATGGVTSGRDGKPIPPKGLQPQGYESIFDWMAVEEQESLQHTQERLRKLRSDFTRKKLVLGLALAVIIILPIAGFSPVKTWWQITKADAILAGDTAAVGSDSFSRYFSQMKLDRQNAALAQLGENVRGLLENATLVDIIALYQGIAAFSRTLEGKQKETVLAILNSIEANVCDSIASFYDNRDANPDQFLAAADLCLKSIPAGECYEKIKNWKQAFDDAKRDTQLKRVQVAFEQRHNDPQTFLSLAQEYRVEYATHKTADDVGKQMIQLESESEQAIREKHYAQVLETFKNRELEPEAFRSQANSYLSQYEKHESTSEVKKLVKQLTDETKEREVQKHEKAFQTVRDAYNRRGERPKVFLTAATDFAGQYPASPYLDQVLQWRSEMQLEIRAQIAEIDPSSLQGFKMRVNNLKGFLELFPGLENTGEMEVAVHAGDKLIPLLNGGSIPVTVISAGTLTDTYKQRLTIHEFRLEKKGQIAEFNEKHDLPWSLGQAISIKIEVCKGYCFLGNYETVFETTLTGVLAIKELDGVLSRGTDSDYVEGDSFSVQVEIPGFETEEWNALENWIAPGNAWRK